MIEAYPLAWPMGWKRTPKHQRIRARFSSFVTVCRGQNQQGQDLGSYQQKRELTIAGSVDRILYELARMGVNRGNVIISTNAPSKKDGSPISNARNPDDAGAAVYWKHAQQTRCMAIDRYDRLTGNLGAIAATLEYMRGIQRHGGAEILNRAFTGFAALPEKASTPWRDVLGIQSDRVTLDMVETAFREMVHMHHPDKGGDPVKFQQIVEARETARRELSSTATAGQGG